MKGRFAGIHVRTVNMLKHLVCPEEPRASGDVLSQLSSTANSQMQLSLLIYFQRRGAPLVFDKPLCSFLNTSDRAVGKTGPMTCSEADGHCVPFDAVPFDIQQGEL